MAVAAVGFTDKNYWYYGTTGVETAAASLFFVPTTSIKQILLSSKTCPMSPCPVSQVNVPSPSNVQCQHVTYISLIPNSTVAREWIVSRLTSHGSRSTVHGPRSTVTSYRLSTIDYRHLTTRVSSICISHLP